MFDSDTQGFYKSEQQESSIMRRSFNPHALQRSAPLLHVGAVYHHEFQSTRPMRGATTLDDLRGSGSLVSIHAPHAGRDPRISRSGISRRQFQSTRPMRGATTQALNTHRGLVVSIHAPRVGRDNVGIGCGLGNIQFQSTRPVWGATPDVVAQTGMSEFQSTRPVWGATQSNGRRCSAQNVSIHAPRVGRDACRTSYMTSRGSFNPRAPCGARPFIARQFADVARFNPRAPCGARPGLHNLPRLAIMFQSTRPVWGATNAERRDDNAITVSIHAPRVGRDALGDTFARPPSFQSTRPVWGATLRPM